jgi:hypothetical protein
VVSDAKRVGEYCHAVIAAGSRGSDEDNDKNNGEETNITSSARNFWDFVLISVPSSH